MSSGTITEIISYFAGYLHIFDTAARERIAYNEYLTSRGQEDYAPERDGMAHAKHAPLDLDTYPTPSHAFADSATHAAGYGLLRSQGTPPLDIPVSDVGAVAGEALSRFSGVSAVSVSSGPSLIKVQYLEGGDQVMFEAGQLNELYDSDTFGTDPAKVAEANGEHDVEVIQSETLSMVLDETPEDLQPSGFGVSQIKQMITERDAARADGEQGSTVEPGTWVDGRLLGEGEEPPRPPEKEDPVEPEGYGLWQYLGGNEMVNAGIIVDVNPAFGTLAVMGDAHHLDAIIQVNAIMDADAVQYSGWLPELVYGAGNETHNIASFFRTDAGFVPPEGAQLFAGTDWKVDVFEGDLVDLKSIQQQSWIIDNDIILQNMNAPTSALYAGGNLVGNFTDFTSLAESYDLVIVMGDIHAANLIYQYNVLYDPDKVSVVSTGEDGTDKQHISTGDNRLTNEAVIETIGAHAYAPMTPQWDMLIEALVNQEGTLDPSFGMGLANFNDPSFDVLLITGDFYDLNAIWQINHLIDADTAMQIASGELPYDSDEYTQVSESGGNSLGNLAAIVDTGPVAGSLVGGDVYEEQVLVQAEIVIDDTDAIETREEGDLVNEIVAFIDDQPAHDPYQGATPPASVADPNGDLLGNTLT